MISNVKPIDRVTQIIQAGLGSDPRKLPYYRQVMVDPRSGFYNLSYRDYALEIYNNLLDYMLNDFQLYTRLRQLLLMANRNMSIRAYETLEQKAEKNDIDLDTLISVYFDGCDRPGYEHLTEEQRGFQSVNSYIANKKKVESVTIKQIKEIAKG